MNYTNVTIALANSKAATCCDFLAELGNATSDMELNAQFVSTVKRFLCSCSNGGVSAARLRCKVSNDDSDVFIYRTECLDLYVALDDENNIVTIKKWEVTNFRYEDQRVLL